MVIPLDDSIQRQSHSSINDLPDKRVLQNLSQFALAKWSVSRILVERSDALFEGQQTFVDFRSFHPEIHFTRKEN